MKDVLNYSDFPKYIKKSTRYKYKHKILNFYPSFKIRYVYRRKTTFKNFLNSRTIYWRVHELGIHFYVPTKLALFPPDKKLYKSVCFRKGRLQKDDWLAKRKCNGTAARGDAK